MSYMYSTELTICKRLKSFKQNKTNNFYQNKQTKSNKRLRLLNGHSTNRRNFNSNMVSVYFPLYQTTGGEQYLLTWTTSQASHFAKIFQWIWIHDTKWSPSLSQASQDNICFSYQETSSENEVVFSQKLQGCPEQSSKPCKIKH